MKISVNILCWNNRKHLMQTLKVLKNELFHVKHEVIIVDNGSDDGTSNLEISEYGDNIIYIRNSTNRGISYGKNQGIDASKGDYIMLLDGDIIPIPGSICCFANFLDERDDVDAIGFYPNKFSNQINRNGQKHHEERCDNLYDPQPHCSHCIYYGMYKRKIFGKVRFCIEGAFGEPGYGWEDFDFNNQMSRFGFNQWVAHVNHPGGKYFHDINSSIRSMGRVNHRETQLKRKALYDERWPVNA